MDIRISYNGKPWAYHTVSEGFLALLQHFLLEHPAFDCIVETSPYGN